MKRIRILMTTNYKKFIIVEGNRNINKLHLKRLRKSIKEEYLFTLIMVNENFEVIDGQHRLVIAEELGLPVYYIVCDGYGLEEIQRYNANAKVWGMDDFLSGYIELGNKEYILFKAFMDTYGLGHKESLVLLHGSNNHESDKEFKLGNLKIKDYDGACKIAEKINCIAPYYVGWRRRNFISAIIHLLKTTPFTVGEFITKLKFQQSKMFDCSKVEQYIAVIEGIYNYKRKDKVSLRFAK